jgi:hypothetical protein
MPANGAVKLSTWATTVAVIVPLLATIFYVGFLSQTNSAAIADQKKTNEAFVAQIDTLRGRVQAQELALLEVETQFCAQDIVRNLMHANDLRDLSLLWQKTFETKLPTDNVFYPTICNRRVK